MPRLACALGALFALAPALLAQGRLDRARLATHAPVRWPRLAPPPSFAPTIGPPRKVARGWDRGISSQGATALVALAALTASSPFWLPHCLMDDELGAPGAFPPHPYAYSRHAYLDVDRELTDPEDVQPGACNVRFAPWAVRASLDESHDLGDVNRLTAEVLLDTASRFGVLTTWQVLSEGTAPGHREGLLLGDLALTYRFAQCGWGVMHAGLGGRLLTDGKDTRGGANFLYRADLFPCDPVVVSARFDVGHLDRALVLHARGSFGLVWEHVEVFAGYDWMRIGGVDLGGPLFGVRLWF